MSVASPETTNSPRNPDVAQSEEFKQASEAERQATSHAQEPISQGGWKRELFNQAIDVYRDRSSFGWDGYEAHPLSIEAIEWAGRLIESLPEWASKPDIVPTPDGEIAFEWHTRTKQVLSAIPKEDLLIYAAALGTKNNHCGEIPFGDKWPEVVLIILRDYFKSGKF